MTRSFCLFRFSSREAFHFTDWCDSDDCMSNRETEPRFEFWTGRKVLARERMIPYHCRRSKHNVTTWPGWVWYVDMSYLFAIMSHVWCLMPFVLYIIVVYTNKPTCRHIRIPTNNDFDWFCSGHKTTRNIKNRQQASCHDGNGRRFWWNLPID